MNFKITVRRTTLWEYEWMVTYDHPFEDNTIAYGGYTWFKRRARAAANKKAWDLQNLYRLG